MFSIKQARPAVGARPSPTPRARTTSRPRPAARARHEKSETITGVVFQPLKEVASVLATTTSTDVLAKPASSLARAPTYGTKLEAGVNEQINIEYNISYIYHGLSAYFSRDSVALPGIAKYFNDSSLEERSHAQLLMDFQGTRGGRVELKTLSPPPSELDHDEGRGDALHAFELALSLEKLNYGKLLALHGLATQDGDAQATQFIEEMLDEQAKDVKEAADRVTVLRRIGTGYPVWEFDRELAEGSA